MTKNFQKMRKSMRGGSKRLATCFHQLILACKLRSIVLLHSCPTILTQVLLLQVDPDDVGFKRLGKAKISDSENESEKEESAEQVNTAAKDRLQYINNWS